MLEADSSEILVEKKSSEGGEAPAKPPKKKEPTPKRTPKPNKEKAPREPTTKKPSKPKSTRKPTNKPKKTPRPTRSTRKPTRAPTVSRRQAERLIAREWTEDECVGSLRRLSQRCKDLDEAVCSQRMSRVTNRYGEKAVEVCEFVGRPITRSEEFDNMYYDLVDISEDEDEDYEETETFADLE